MQTTPNSTSITDDQIRQLRDEASSADDPVTVDMCTIALDGDSDGTGTTLGKACTAAQARAECARIISDARAQIDTTRTRSRYENLRLIESVIGRRLWSEDNDTVGGIVSRYPDRDAAHRDEQRLAAQGLQCSTSADAGGKGYLWVVVGES